MTTSESAIVMAIILTSAMMLPTLREQLRTDRAGVIKTLKLAGVYRIYVIAGIAFVLLRVYYNPHTNGLAVMVFLLAWILYGVLWLTRTVPRYREIPGWIDKRFTVLDGVLVAIIAVSAWYCIR
ncbi:MAG TPA: hypothetical protein VID74_07155 [Gemmatimonadales bacterium]